MGWLFERFLSFSAWVVLGIVLVVVCLLRKHSYRVDFLTFRSGFEKGNALTGCLDHLSPKYSLFQLDIHRVRRKCCSPKNCCALFSCLALEEALISLRATRTECRVALKDTKPSGKRRSPRLGGGLNRSWAERLEHAKRFGEFACYAKTLSGVHLT